MKVLIRKFEKPINRLKVYSIYGALEVGFPIAVNVH